MRQFSLPSWVSRRSGSANRRRRAAAAPAAEQLESRRLLAAELNLTATQFDDFIGIGTVGDDLYLDVNGTLSFFPIGSISTIELNAGNGNDQIFIGELADHLSLDILGMGGNDLVSIGQDLDTQVRAADVKFFGGEGLDTFLADDSLDEAGNDTWTITGRSFKKNTTGDFTHTGVEFIDLRPSSFAGNMNLLDLDAVDNTVGLRMRLGNPTGGNYTVRIADAGGSSAFLEGDLDVVGLKVRLQGPSITGPGSVNLIDSTLIVPLTFTSLPGAASGARFVLNGSNITGPGTFVNQDVFVFAGGGTVAANITNQGTFLVKDTPFVTTANFNNAASGLFRLEQSSLAATGGKFVQAGRMELIDSDAAFTGTFTNTGVVAAANDLTLGDRTITAGAIVSPNGDFEINGFLSLVLAAPSVTLGAGTLLSGTGRLFLPGNATLNLPSNLILPAAGPDFDFENLSGTGAGKVINRRILAFFDKAVNFKLRNEGTLLANGTTSFNRAFENPATGVLFVTGATGFVEETDVSIAQGFTNNGQIILGDDGLGPIDLSLTIGAGTLVNGPTGSVSTFSSFSAERLVVAPGINNQGLLFGNLAIIGNVVSSGEVNPGEDVAGTMTITGNYTQTAAGALVADLGPQSDRLVVTGAASLAGELLLKLLPGFTPASDATATVLTAGNLIGDFTTKQVAPAPGISYTTAKAGGNYNVTARNAADVPKITNFGAAVTWIEGNNPARFAASAVVTDANSTNFNGGNLTARLTAGAQAPDRLEIRNEGTGDGQISVSGATVRFTTGGVANDIGTFTGGTGGTALVVTLSAQATKAATQALLRNLTFRSVSDAPGTQARTVVVTINDGQGTSDPATKTLNLTATNDAPAITGIGAAVTYVENAAPLLILANTTAVADPDSLDLATGKLTVSYTSGGTGADRLAIRNQGTAAGQIGVSGSNVTFGGTTIGTFTGGTGLVALVVTFNASATPAAAQALLRNITFANVSETPATTNRVVRFTLTDGDGGTGTAAKTVRVTAVNDAPALGGISGAVNYTAGGAGLVIASSATVADIDSADFNTGKLTVRVAAGGQASLDKLEIRNQGIGAGQVGVNGTNVTFAGAVVGAFGFNSTTLTLTVTFNASATAAIVQAVARNVTFRNTSATPATAARTVEFQLTDGDGGTSAAVTKTVNVAASALAVNAASAFAAYEEWQTAL